jgi:hypothetical protein
MVGHHRRHLPDAREYGAAGRQDTGPMPAIGESGALDGSGGTQAPAIGDSDGHHAANAESVAATRIV